MGYYEKGETFTEDFPGNEKNGEVKSNFEAKVKKNGSLILPPEIARKLGLAPGAKVDIVHENDRAFIHSNIHSLARVYIDPTSVCNLTCQTCIRNTWAEPLGYMEMGIFNRLVEQLQKVNKKSPHKIDLGIAFVIMRKNIEDLKNIGRLIWAIGARKVSVSNVLP